MLAILTDIACREVRAFDPGTPRVRKLRAKCELTPEEKAAFHARMVAGRLV